VISDSLPGNCFEHNRAQLSVKFSDLRGEVLVRQMIERFDVATNNGRQSISCRFAEDCDPTPLLFYVNVMGRVVQEMPRPISSPVPLPGQGICAIGGVVSLVHRRQHRDMQQVTRFH